MTGKKPPRRAPWHLREFQTDNPPTKIMPADDWQLLGDIVNGIVHRLQFRLAGKTAVGYRQPHLNLNMKETHHDNTR